MRPSRQLVRFVAGWEGFRSCPYQDSGGHWTRGYGETEGIGPDSPCISKRDARRQLRYRINRDFAPWVTKLITRRLRQREFDALVSFVYNLGPYTLQNSTLRRRLNAKGTSKRQAFREELPRFVYAGGSYSEGLARRRQAEVRIAVYGDYSERP